MEPGNDIIGCIVQNAQQRKMLNSEQCKIISNHQNMAASVLAFELQNPPTAREIFEYSTEYSYLIIQKPNESTSIVADRKTEQTRTVFRSDELFLSYPLVLFSFSPENSDVGKVLEMYRLGTSGSEKIKEKNLSVDLMTLSDILANRRSVQELEGVVGSQIVYQELWKLFLNQLWTESNLLIKVTLLIPTLQFLSKSKEISNSDYELMLPCSEETIREYYNVLVRYVKSKY